MAVTSCYNDATQSEPQAPTSTEGVYTNHPDAMAGKLAILVSEELGAQLESLVVTKSNVGDVITSQTLLDAGITSIKRMFPYAGKFEARTREAGLHLWYNVSFDESIPSTRVANGFFEMEGVIKVQDRIKYKSFDQKPVIADTKSATTRANDEEDIFNDPFVYLQWHYKNDADVEGFVKGMDINITPVWASGVTGRPEVVVAVVDGGIDYDHPDLAANMHINEAELNGVAGVDDDNNGFVDDIYGYNFVMRTGDVSEHDHGTHVAGTVAAVNNNGIGVAGVAGGNGDPNSGIRMISCQMLHTSTSTGEDITGDETSAAEAIKYGADAGAVISQNSWGYVSATLMDYDTAAIDYFVEYAGIDENGDQVGPMKGGIVVFAAGNESATYANPGQHPTALCVTSISPDGMMAPYSNYGDWADIAAPGGEQDRWEAYVGGVLSTIPVGKYEADYGSFTGTSMACPHVSGVIALYISKCVEEGNTEGLTPDMVLDRLLNTTRSLVESEPEYYSLMGSGLIDAARFVGVETSTTPSPVSDLELVEAKYTSLIVDWSIPSNAKGYTLFCSENSLDGVDFDNLPEGVRSLDINKFANAEGKMEMSVADLTPETTYYLAIRSWDYGDNVSTVSTPISATTDRNYAPQFFKDDVLVEGSDVVTVDADSQVKLSYVIKDPEDGEFTYKFTAGSAAESEPIYNKSSQTLTIYIVGSKVEAGTYEATVVATDKFGGEGSMSILYTISPNEAPVVVAPIEDIQLMNIGTSFELDIDGVFEDEDTPLSYSVESSDKSIIVATINSNNKLELLTQAYGTSQITLTATDALGAPSRCDFEVTCKSSSSDYSVTLYPNPVTTTLNIMSDALSIEKVIFYDSRGAEVQSIEGDSRSIDVSALKSGVYSVDVVIEGVSNIKSITKL